MAKCRSRPLLIPIIIQLLITVLLQAGKSRHTLQSESVTTLNKAHNCHDNCPSGRRQVVGGAGVSTAALRPSRPSADVGLSRIRLAPRSWLPIALPAETALAVQQHRTWEDGFLPPTRDSSRHEAQDRSCALSCTVCEPSSGVIWGESKSVSALNEGR